MQNQDKILSSTPTINIKALKKIKELSFPINCDNKNETTDNSLGGDSGYVSHLEESNIGEGNIEKYNSHLFYLNDSSISSLLKDDVNEKKSNVLTDQINVSGRKLSSTNQSKSHDQYNLSSKTVKEKNISFNVEEKCLNSTVSKCREISLTSSKKKRTSPLKRKLKFLEENKENILNNSLLFSRNYVQQLKNNEKLSSVETHSKKGAIKLNNSSTCKNEKDDKNAKSSCCLSPELFSDEETMEYEDNNYKTAENKVCHENLIDKDDEKLLVRVQKTLQGVLPPPSVTTIQISTNEILNKIHQNNHLFLKKEEVELVKRNNETNETECNEDCNDCTLEKCKDEKICFNSKLKRKSLLYTCDKSNIEAINWPQLMKYKYHGLLFNKNKFSEDFEHLCQKYGERYVCAETQSTCTVFLNDVSSKRITRLRKMGKSPGKRLSYLARRRTMSTKDSLHSSSFINSRSRQILMDARKQAVLGKSPQKSPSKSPKVTPRKSPSSSMKKKRNSELFFRANIEASISASSSPTRSSCDSFNGTGEPSSIISTDSSTTSKRRTPRRALFSSSKKLSPQAGLSSLYSKKKSTPKRALFMSPEKDKRWKKDDEGNDQMMIKNKISRSMSWSTQSTTSSDNSKTFGNSSIGSLGLPSCHCQNQELSDHRKKKLLWAVSEALRSQNISMDHSQFKVFASVLARVTRRLLPNLNMPGSRPEGSTSEFMLKIARKHVFAVTRGKTVDEIIHEVEKSKIGPSKPTGYIAPEKVRMDYFQQIKENVLQPKLSTSYSTLNQSNQQTHNLRNEKVERIRRAINFSECQDENI